MEITNSIQFKNENFFHIYPHHILLAESKQVDSYSP